MAMLSRPSTRTSRGLGFDALDFDGVALLDFSDDLLGGGGDAAGIEREIRAFGSACKTKSVTMTSSRWRLLRTARELPNSPMAAETISRAAARVQAWMVFRWVAGNRMIGAGDGIRTRDIDLGKVALYQLSYSRLSETLILTSQQWACQTSMVAAAVSRRSDRR